MTAEMFMTRQDERGRAYVLVEIQPGKEKDFYHEVLSKGLILDSKVERMDFVHGPFDFVIVLRGTVKDIDHRIMEMRKSPFIRRTETLICFEMFTWDDLSEHLNGKS
jgi:broad-specificity NMP kinase